MKSCTRHVERIDELTKEVSGLRRQVNGLQGELRNRDQNLKRKFNNAAWRNQARQYIEFLEARLSGEVRSFASLNPKMHTVPAGWFLGLREENAMLRARIKQEPKEIA